MTYHIFTMHWSIFSSNGGGFDPRCRQWTTCQIPCTQGEATARNEASRLVAVGRGQKRGVPRETARWARCSWPAIWDQFLVFGKDQKCFPFTLLMSSILSRDVLRVTGVNAHVTPREWISDIKMLLEAGLESKRRRGGSSPNIYHIIWNLVRNLGHSCIAVGFFRDWYCKSPACGSCSHQQNRRGMDAFVDFC